MGSRWILGGSAFTIPADCAIMCAEGLALQGLGGFTPAARLPAPSHIGLSAPPQLEVTRMISVIIPTYNRCALLLRAIRSVLDQTCPDLECLVIDDGSTDGTEAALRAIGDPRLHYVRQDHAGACAARNLGVSLAKGAYIAFQDSDDVWHPDKLEKQLSLLKSTGADVAACAMVRDGISFPPHIPDGPLSFDALLRESLCSTQCLLGRAEVFRQVPFDPDMPRLQDWDLLLRLTENHRVVFSAEPLVDVYLQPDSISSQPEKLHQALVRLYGKFHGAVNAPQRGTDLSLQWMRNIIETAPPGASPWTEELLLIAPAWVCREVPEGPVCICTGAFRSCKNDQRAFRSPFGNLRGPFFSLDISSYTPDNGAQYLPEPLLPEVLRRASSITFIGAGEGLAGALTALTAWKGRRYAWDLLCSVRGTGEAAAELAAQHLLEMPAWARALRDVSFPEKTGPVRRIGVYYHSLRGGGVQRVAAFQATLFADMGLKVTLVTEGSPDPADFPVPASVQRKVIPALDPSSPDTNRAHVSALHRIAQDLDLLVYNAWADPLILFDVLALRGAGCRCVIQTHSVFTLPLLESGMQDRFAALPDVYAHASAVVTLSEADAAYWRHACPRVYVTANPLTYHPEETPVNALRGKTILWAGRLSKEKRPLDAIDILAKVVQRVPEARLLLVGGGDEALRGAIERRIEAHGLTGHVTLPGYQTDMTPWYRQSDLFLCTSAYEGFSLTMAEAQTHGIPCVTYGMPYLTILEGGGHISVPQGDINAAAEALIRLLTDGPARIALGHAARRNVEEHLCGNPTDLWRRILADVAAPLPPRPVPDAQQVMLATLREHAACGPAAAVEEHRTTAFVPLPERGLFKRLRKKAATFLQVLLIDGPGGIRRVLREKREK